MKRRPLAVVREEISQPRNLASDWAIYTAVVVAAVASYANGLSGEFVHDDIPAIVTNGDVIGTNSIKDLFTNDFWGTPMSDVNSHKSYRPLTTLSFRFNHALSGLRPWWFHAANAALHACASGLFARTCLLVARLQRPFAAIGGLLFALHPIHTEAVTGIVGRADVLACIFFLSSLLMYHGTTSGNHCVATSVVLGALSMLAKETGVTVFILNLAFDIYRCWPSIKKTMVDVKWNKKTTKFTARTIKVLVSLMVVIAARLALLQGALPTFSQQDNPTAFHPDFFVRLMTFCYLAAFNWWLLLCPWNLSHDWQMGSVPLVTSVGDPRNFVTCAAFGAVLFLSYRCLTDVEAHRHVPLVLGLLLLVLPFMPATNLFVTVGFVIAERVLYIPSVGSVLITVYGAQLIWRSRRGGRTFISIGLLALLVCGYARTVQRNRAWQSKEVLLRTDLVTLPHNAKLHYNYANFLRDKERQDDAIQHYKEAIRLWPSYASAHNNLGTLIVTSGKAEYHFLQAIKYSQDHINAHYNLGKLYRKSNKYTEALKMLERCIVLEPRFIQAYLELVLLKPDSERGRILKKVINLEPNNWQHYISYGKWLSMQKLLTAALNMFIQGLKTTQMMNTKGTSHSRGDIIALRSASITLRSLGQKSRILQLITRWHIFRKGSTNPATRNIYLREWQLKMELAGRAKIYAQVSHAPPNSKTCFDHSQLEITSESMQAKGQPFPQSGANHYSDNDYSASVESNKYHNVKTNFRQTYIVVNENSSKSSITSGITECLQTLTDRHGTKHDNVKPSRTLSISTQYKLTHNRSESGHKRKECSSSPRTEHRKDHNKIRKCKVQNRVKDIEYAANDNIQPFLTEHLIQTF